MRRPSRSNSGRKQGVARPWRPAQPSRALGFLASLERPLMRASMAEQHGSPPVCFTHLLIVQGFALKAGVNHVFVGVLQYVWSSSYCAKGECWEGHGRLCSCNCMMMNHCLKYFGIVLHCNQFGMPFTGLKAEGVSSKAPLESSRVCLLHLLSRVLIQTRSALACFVWLQHGGKLHS